MLLAELNDACHALLQANEPVLRKIADRLLELETVPGETVYRLIQEHAATGSGAVRLAQEAAAA